MTSQFPVKINLKLLFCFVFFPGIGDFHKDLRLLLALIKASFSTALAKTSVLRSAGLRWLFRLFTIADCVTGSLLLIGAKLHLWSDKPRSDRAAAAAQAGKWDTVVNCRGVVALHESLCVYEERATRCWRACHRRAAENRSDRGGKRKETGESGNTLWN